MEGVSEIDGENDGGTLVGVAVDDVLLTADTILTVARTEPVTLEVPPGEKLALLGDEDTENSALVLSVAEEVARGVPLLDTEMLITDGEIDGVRAFEGVSQGVPGMQRASPSGTFVIASPRPVLLQQTVVGGDGWWPINTSPIHPTHPGLQVELGSVPQQ